MGGEGDNRGWDCWMASPTQRTWVWVNSGSWWWTGSSGMCGSWGHKESDTTQRLDWTEPYARCYFVLPPKESLTLPTGRNCNQTQQEEKLLLEVPVVYLGTEVLKQVFLQSYRQFLKKAAWAQGKCQTAYSGEIGFSSFWAPCLLYSISAWSRQYKRLMSHGFKTESRFQFQIT